MESNALKILETWFLKVIPANNKNHIVNENINTVL